MPGQEVTQLVYEFIGQTDQLNKAAAQVQETIQKNVEQPMEKMNDAALLGGAKLRKAFFGIGEAVSLVAGPQLGNMMFRITSLVPVVDRLGGAFGKVLNPIVNFMAGPWGIALLAFGAVVMAVKNFTKENEKAAAAAAKLKEQQDALNATLEATAGIGQKPYEALLLDLNELRVRTALFGSQTDKLSGFIDKTRDAMTKLVVASQALGTIDVDIFKNPDEWRKAFDLKGELGADYDFLKKMLEALQAIKTEQDLNAAAAEGWERAQADLAVTYSQTAQASAAMLAEMEKSDLGAITRKQVESATTSWNQWVGSLEANMADVYTTMQSITTMAVQGLGDAVAGAIIYQQNFGKAMMDLGKRVAASLISTLIQLAVEELIYAAFGQALIAKKASSELAVASSLAAAWAYVAAVREMGLAGIFSGAAFAGLASAMLIGSALVAGAAGAAAGTGIAAMGAAVPGAQYGALTLRPGLLRVHADEVVAPRSRFESLMNKSSEPLVLINELDGRVLSEVVIRNAPGIVRVRGGVRGG